MSEPNVSGTSVHYVHESGQHLDAVIVTPPRRERPYDDSSPELPAELVVFLPDGERFTTTAHEHAGGNVGTWHWPEPRDAWGRLIGAATGETTRLDAGEV